MASDLNHARMPIGPVGHPTETALAVNAMAFKHTKYPNAAKAYLTYMMEAPQYDHWLTDSFGYWSQPLKRLRGRATCGKRTRRSQLIKTRWQDSLWLGYDGADQRRPPAPW